MMMMMRMIKMMEIINRMTKLIKRITGIRMDLWKYSAMKMSLIKVPRIKRKNNNYKPLKYNL